MTRSSSTVEEVLTLHEDQLRLFGGAAGVRDRNALESAVMTAATTYDGAFLHDDLFHMAAAYAYHIAENHSCGFIQIHSPFSDAWIDELTLLAL